MRGRRRILAAWAAVCVSGALASTAQGQQAPQSWKVASAAQPGSVLVGYVDETAARITAGSSGAIKAERLFVGSEQEICRWAASRWPASRRRCPRPVC